MHLEKISVYITAPSFFLVISLSSAFIFPRKEENHSIFFSQGCGIRDHEKMSTDTGRRVLGHHSSRAIHVRFSNCYHTKTILKNDIDSVMRLGAAPSVSTMESAKSVIIGLYPRTNLLKPTIEMGYLDVKHYFELYKHGSLKRHEVFEANNGATYLILFDYSILFPRHKYHQKKTFIIAAQVKTTAQFPMCLCWNYVRLRLQMRRHRNFAWFDDKVICSLYSRKKITKRLISFVG